MGSSSPAFRSAATGLLLAASVQALGGELRVVPLRVGLNGAGCGYTGLEGSGIPENRRLTEAQAREVAYGRRGHFLVSEWGVSPAVAARISIGGEEHELRTMSEHGEEFANDEVNVRVERKSDIPIECPGGCAGSFARVTVAVEKDGETARIDALQHCGD